MTSPSILVIGDFQPAGKPNDLLIRHVEQVLLTHGVKVTVARPGTTSQRLSGVAADADGVMVVAHECNRSYSGAIKTLLDSVETGSVTDKPFALMSYTDTQPAATAVDHLRIVVSAMEGVPIPAEVRACLSRTRKTEQVAAELADSIAVLVDQLLHYAGRMARDRALDWEMPKLVRSGPPHGFELAEPVDGQIYAGIALAVTYIKERFSDQNLSLDTVASAVFMSRYHFSRKFRQETGRRFIDYLIMLRMTEARKLLIETNQTVTAIAVEVGYRDLSNFERSFKKLFGIQPSQYRLRHSGSTAVRPAIIGLRGTEAPQATPPEPVARRKA